MRRFIHVTRLALIESQTYLRSLGAIESRVNDSNTLRIYWAQQMIENISKKDPKNLTNDSSRHGSPGPTCLAVRAAFVLN